MGRTYVTSVSTCTLYGAYKCSKCGKIVKFEKVVNSTADASRAGITYSEKKLAPLKDSTGQEASEHIGTLAYGEIMAVEHKGFKDAYLHCSCECGHREEWASFIPTLDVLGVERPFLARTIIRILFFGILFSFIALIISIGQKDWWPVIITGIIWACILSFIPVRNWINNNKEIKCQTLSEENAPHLFFTKEERDTFAEIKSKDIPKETIQAEIKMQTDTSLESMVSKTISTNEETSEDELVFCYKCGNRLRPGSVFCSKCGTKLR